MQENSEKKSRDISSGVVESEKDSKPNYDTDAEEQTIVGIQLPTAPVELKNRIVRDRVAKKIDPDELLIPPTKKIAKGKVGRPKKDGASKKNDGGAKPVAN